MSEKLKSMFMKFIDEYADELDIANATKNYCICQPKIQSKANRKFSHSLLHRTAVKNHSSRPFFN